jgi:DNA-binding NarL/FixJ family response regulator
MTANPVPPPGGERRRVLLAIFDFPLLLLGYRAAIDAEPDMQVVAAVEDPAELAPAVEHSSPDVVIVEWIANGPGSLGTEIIELVRAAGSGARVVALDGRPSGEQFSLALRAGADGFLAREAHPADVLAAIRCVSRGETYVDPTIVTRIVNTYVLRGVNVPVDDPYETLTDREREILRLAAVGHTNREIAEALRVSPQSVHSHRASAMEKLGLHDRVELLRYAVRRGVVDVGAR